MDVNIQDVVVSCLGRGGGAREVIFLAKDLYRPVDYSLEGVLRLTLLKERGYYYGSFAYAWLTWICGLPLEGQR